MLALRFHAALVAGVLVGCGEASRSEPPPATQHDAPPVQPPAHAAEAEPAKTSPGVLADGTIVSAVPWFEGTLEQALARAESEHKLVLADVGAYWCPPCQRYEEEVFTRPEVGTALGERFVSVHVDAEIGQGPELVKQHRVLAYPTLLVLEPSGLERGRVVDFLPANALLAALERIERSENVLTELTAAVERNPDDVEARYRLGSAHAVAAQRTEAEAEFEKVLLADPKNELGLASKVLFDRALFFRAKLEQDAEGAIEEFHALETRFPDSPEATAALRQIGRLLHGLGRTDEAIAALDRMLAKDPRDTGLAKSYGWFGFRERCRPERGLEVVTTALDHTPADAELHYLRGELEHLVGNDAAALASMRKASALDPSRAFYKRQVRRFEPSAGA